MKYFIKKERIGDENYFMIYKKFFFINIFSEKWNSEVTAKARLAQLNEKNKN